MYRQSLINTYCHEKKKKTKLRKRKISPEYIDRITRFLITTWKIGKTTLIIQSRSPAIFTQITFFEFNFSFFIFLSIYLISILFSNFFFLCTHSLHTNRKCSEKRVKKKKKNKKKRCNKTRMQRQYFTIMRIGWGTTANKGF